MIAPLDPSDTPNSDLLSLLDGFLIDPSFSLAINLALFSILIKNKLATAEELSSELSTSLDILKELGLLNLPKGKEGV